MARCCGRKRPFQAAVLRCHALGTSAQRVFPPSWGSWEPLKASVGTGQPLDSHGPVLLKTRDGVSDVSYPEAPGEALGKADLPSTNP